MPDFSSSRAASSLSRALQQGQSCPSIQRSSGAFAAGLHSLDNTRPPARSASGLAKTLQAHNPLLYCQPDALRVERSLPVLGPPSRAYVDFTDARNSDAIVYFAKLNLWAVASLHEGWKQQYFLRSTRATLAILLYEFATGTGPTDRAFGEEHAIVKSLREVPSTQMALKFFYDENKGLGSRGAQPKTYGYQFSPNLSLSGVINSYFAHKRAVTSILTELDFLQLFLGGIVYQLRPAGGLIDITVSDAKGRSTWYLHAGAIWNRARNVARNPTHHYPQPLATINQSYQFQIAVEEHRLFTTEQWMNNAQNEASKLFRMQW